MATYDPPLHPTRAHLPRGHEDNFKDAIESINSAVQRSLSDGKKYQEVKVVCLRWSNDDIGLHGVTEELVQTFRDVYSYPAETITIPDEASRCSLYTTSRLSVLVDNNNASTTLLIVVYEGHVCRSATDPESLLIFGSSAYGAPTINWNHIKAIFDQFCGDVLVIMDCCEATTAAMRNSEVEYLFASATESATTAVITNSFTQRLISLMRESAGADMTVAQIHAKMVENSGDVANFLDSSPVHVAPQTKKSIVLRPFKREPPELRDIKKRDSMSRGKVLISVRLQGMHGVPDINQWKSWLAQGIPRDVADIRIQGVFDTSSTLCLLTVPIEVWDMMGGSDAYSFIEYVSSDNKCLGQQTLPARHRRAATTTDAASAYPGLGEAVSGNIARPWRGSSKD